MKAPRTHCKRGHPITDRNSRWSGRKGGKRYRSCKLCRSYLARLKYDTDAEHRERCKAYAKAYAAAERQQQQGATP